MGLDTSRLSSDGTYQAIIHPACINEAKADNSPLSVYFEGGYLHACQMEVMLQLFWYRILMHIGLKGEEIYYIGGSEALPPPLSREEELHLLERLPRRRRSSSGNVN